MALTGIQIYKLLPQTNCKDCGFPTCLAFAMKLAAKQVELSACPHVSESAKAQLAESAAPPVRLVTVRSDGAEVKVGNEVVLFRHEKTFYNRPGLIVRVGDDLAPSALEAKVAAADAYRVTYVGIDLGIDGFAVESVKGDPAAFAAAVQAVRRHSRKPLVLTAPSASVLGAGLEMLGAGETPLLGVATADNWRDMAGLAQKAKSPLIVRGNTLDELATLTGQIKDMGVEDMVLDPAVRDFAGHLTLSTLIRRLALKKNFRPLGYPLIAFPAAAGDPAVELMLAAQAILKYAGFVVIDHFAPEAVYPLLVLRQNIYTDPQKPIQVQPGLYEINNPKPEDPVLVTTNFSITYFSVANEVEGSGLPAWLVVADAEGMSVLTAWAAGKFDAERIAKDVKRFGVADRVSRRRLVIPGHVAVLSGELEGELPDWEIRVGPREAVDLPRYMREALMN
ncbi:MAG: acetyl-CoA decarbonylase/synthase complex subunit gamma [Caldilineales bacterium]|nr:acetyl-CoA decarbonylase/synthase complex subunit gamma [Caldilineales bacterium]